MTNGEKAREISLNIARSYYSAYKGALDMAEWKDQQFKARLGMKLNEQKEKFKNERELYKHYDWVTEGKIALLDEIINELFEETESDNSDREE